VTAETSNDRELDIVRSLGHPTRRAILNRMIATGEPTSPKEITEMTGRALHSIGYHVRMLAQAKVITLDHTEPRRGALEHFYRVMDLPEWALTILAAYPQESP
jgi:predicted transcriptional regulator